ncbi:hypothetical protein RFI_34764 [Reticulomyxa filosa]|uniref:Uncharacterized protein n=1 Tax=Reticulomyxa filosa TaxID=46433 RepID=X6LL21_RETFI|nr:hypothetical protein RFI_34764 [Reticulomyxa filosa]|eukprot:ETO02653.1 hypothetical protein RFI_34764 [Reticulomyxa filosa]
MLFIISISECLRLFFFANTHTHTHGLFFSLTTYTLAKNEKTNKQTKMIEERLKQESKVFEDAKKFAQEQRLYDERKEDNNGENVFEQEKIRAISCIHALEQKIRETKIEIQRIEDRAINGEGDSEVAPSARQEEVALYLQSYQSKKALKKFTSNTKKFDTLVKDEKKELYTSSFEKKYSLVFNFGNVQTMNFFIEVVIPVKLLSKVYLDKKFRFPLWKSIEMISDQNLRHFDGLTFKCQTFSQYSYFSNMKFTRGSVKSKHNNEREYQAFPCNVILVLCC